MGNGGFLQEIPEYQMSRREGMRRKEMGAAALKSVAEGKEGQQAARGGRGGGRESARALKGAVAPPLQTSRSRVTVSKPLLSTLLDLSVSQTLPHPLLLRTNCNCFLSLILRRRGSCPPREVVAFDNSQGLFLSSSPPRSGEQM